MSKVLTQTTGRRKRAIARVIFREGTGEIKVNGKDVSDYFVSQKQQSEALAPLQTTNTLKSYKVEANIIGGGLMGQAGALKMGIARSLVELDPSLRQKLKSEGMLTRDDREKESKKYGLKKARKASQFSKR